MLALSRFFFGCWNTVALSLAGGLKSSARFSGCEALVGDRIRVLFPPRLLPNVRDCMRLFVLVCALAFSSATHAEDKLVFGRDVLPILSDNCFHCHGPE